LGINDELSELDIKKVISPKIPTNKTSRNKFNQRHEKFIKLNLQNIGQGN
jgi:hypothetical protein